jgi:hypothetical protein
MLSMLDYVMLKVLILELDYLWDNEKICTYAHISFNE